MSKRGKKLKPRMETTMKRLLLLTALASLYPAVASACSAAAALLAQLQAASEPVWLDPAATSPGSLWHRLSLRHGRVRPAGPSRTDAGAG
jgi:hypothetical protein